MITMLLVCPPVSHAGNVQRSPLWPGGTIEFTICEESISGLDTDKLRAKLIKRGCDTAGDDWADHLVSTKTASLIRSAKTSWNKQFPKVTLHESDEIDLKSHYVRFFVKDDGRPCSSIGIGFEIEKTNHDIWVNDKCARDNEYVLMHEIMHRIGIYHEQCRKEVPPLFSVSYTNPKDTDWPYQFRTVGDSEGPYDFASVMHYPLKNGDFAINLNDVGKKVLGSIAPKTVGDFHGLSAGDIATVRALYGT